MEASKPTAPQPHFLGLKVDVDTHDGMRDGVPRLLEIFREEHVRATFFLSFGPDNAGKAIFNIFREKGFLKKMLKTKAPSLYGLRTILSGTLLPPRPIATKFPEIVRQIESENHECEIHAWDHRAWQDHIESMPPQEIRWHFSKAHEAYQKILFHPAKAAAAPSWRITDQVISIETEMGFHYTSDLREGPPCFLISDSGIASPLQLPTTGPCIEELLTLGITEPQEWISRILESSLAAPYPIIALHAEVEGGPYTNFLISLLQELKKHAFEISPLAEMAEHLLKNEETIPRRRLCRITLPGRAGWVASSCEK